MSESRGSAADNPAGATPQEKRPTLLVVVVGLVAVEALAMLAATVWLLVGLAGGQAGSLSTTIALAVLLLAIGVFLFASAVGLWRGNRWPRAAVVCWQLLTAIVAVTTMRGGLLWAGIGILVFCLVVLVCLFVPSVMRATNANGDRVI